MYIVLKQFMLLHQDILHVINNGLINYGFPLKDTF